MVLRRRQRAPCEIGAKVHPSVGVVSATWDLSGTDEPALAPARGLQARSAVLPRQGRDAVERARGRLTGGHEVTGDGDLGIDVLRHCAQGVARRDGQARVERNVGFPDATGAQILGAGTHCAGVRARHSGLDIKNNGTRRAWGWDLIRVHVDRRHDHRVVHGLDWARAGAAASVMAATASEMISVRMVSSSGSGCASHHLRRVAHRFREPRSVAATGAKCHARKFVGGRVQAVGSLR